MCVLLTMASPTVARRSASRLEPTNACEFYAQCASESRLIYSHDPEVRQNGPMVTTVATLALAALVTGLSLAGVLFPEVIYPTESLRASLAPNDLQNLLVGLPALLVSLVLFRRQDARRVRTHRPLGVLLLPGAIFYLTYNYLVYLFALPQGLPLLGSGLIVAGSLYTLVNAGTAVDWASIGRAAEARAPARVAGGVAAVMGIAFLLRAAGLLLGPAAGMEVIPDAELALNLTDLLVSPAWILAGALLVLKRPAGFSLSIAVLFQASLLFLGLIVLLLVRPSMTDVPFDLGELLAVCVLGLLAFLPFAVLVALYRRS